MGRALMALLVLLGAAPAAPARDALEVIDGCIARLDPELDVGFDKIATRCPELAPSLARSPWSAWLPAEWDEADNGLSVEGLRELRALLAAESRRAAALHAPDAGHAAAVLASLTPPAQGHGSAWQRFKAWLRGSVTARRGAPDPGGLGRLLEAFGHPGPGLAIAIGALALLTLLAGALLVSALRGAGLLRWRRPAGARTAAAEADPGTAARARLESAAPLERPRLLLELIASRLAALERLPPARALTVHELLLAAQLPAADHARLAALVAACERLTFSGRRLSAHELGDALERGRELLEGLAGASA